MLYPAQLYKDELKKRMTACWYNPRYSYFFDGWYQEWEVSDNGNSFREFVHLNKLGVVDGYFGHRFNQVSRSLRDFGLISFTTDNNIGFIHDVINYITDMFSKGIQRVEFWAFTDNPCTDGYLKLLKRFGGKQVAYYTRASYFDGAYHDSIGFEILSENLLLKTNNKVHTVDDISMSKKLNR